MLMNSWSGTGAEHLQASLNEYFNSLDRPLGMEGTLIPNETPEYPRSDVGLSSSQVRVTNIHFK